MHLQHYCIHYVLWTPSADSLFIYIALVFIQLLTQQQNACKFKKRGHAERPYAAGGQNQTVKSLKGLFRGIIRTETNSQPPSPEVVHLLDDGLSPDATQRCLWRCFSGPEAFGGKRHRVTGRHITMA